MGALVGDYIAAEGPAWVWIAAVLGLLLFGVVMGVLGWVALKWATRQRSDKLIRTDMILEIGAHHERIEALEWKLERAIKGMPADARPTAKSPAPS